MIGNLALQLREGTRNSHALSENTAFMQCFLKGKITKNVFRKLLGNFYLIYYNLESELLNNYSHPVVRKIYFPQLNRTLSIEKDLAFYYGENWREKISLCPAVRDYVTRIREVGVRIPELLVAHSYVRYLGDLSGGQGLKRIVRASFDLPSGQGTQFYEFDHFSTFEAQKEFKVKYRNALNSLPINENTAQKIVAEANYVFRLNCNLLHALEGDIKTSLGEAEFELITSNNQPGSTENNLELSPVS